MRVEHGRNELDDCQTRRDLMIVTVPCCRNGRLAAGGPVIGSCYLQNVRMFFQSTEEPDISAYLMLYARLHTVINCGRQDSAWFTSSSECSTSSVLSGPACCFG